MKIGKLGAAAAMLAVISSAHVVCAQGARGVPARGAAPAPFSGVNADARARATADSIRAALLGMSTFAGFSTAPCSPGDVRTFERDTTGISKALLKRLELLVLSYGAFASLDTPSGKALLRAVVRIETGGPAPRWDTMTGTGPRVFNPLLPADLYNSETKKCQETPGLVPNGVVLPAVTGFVVPRDSGAGEFDVGYGDKSLNDLRNLFFSRHRGDTSAVMYLARVNAHAIWENYAIVSIKREQERQGSVVIEGRTTGAVYAFHRAPGGEWKVLALVRNY